MIRLKLLHRLFSYLAMISRWGPLGRLRRWCHQPTIRVLAFGFDWRPKARVRMYIDDVRDVTGPDFTALIDWLLSIMRKVYTTLNFQHRAWSCEYLLVPSIDCWKHGEVVNVILKRRSYQIVAKIRRKGKTVYLWCVVNFYNILHVCLLLIS